MAKRCYVMTEHKVHVNLNSQALNSLIGQCLFNLKALEIKNKNQIQKMLLGESIF